MATGLTMRGVDKVKNGSKTHKAFFAWNKTKPKIWFFIYPRSDNFTRKWRLSLYCNSREVLGTCDRPYYGRRGPFELKFLRKFKKFQEFIYLPTLLCSFLSIGPNSISYATKLHFFWFLWNSNRLAKTGRTIETLVINLPIGSSRISVHISDHSFSFSLAWGHLRSGGGWWNTTSGFYFRLWTGFFTLLLRYGISTKTSRKSRSKSTLASKWLNNTKG